MFFWYSIETYYFTKTLFLILATNLKHSIPKIISIGKENITYL